MPYVSLDVAQTPSGYMLFEFQALNFGPITLIKSPGWYEETESGDWAYKEGPSDLAEEMGRALVWYVRNSKGEGTGTSG
jgi:hypothetical protein